MNKKKVLVIAPHPDDETLGCGGTLLLLKEKGYSINWLIATSISEELGFSKKDVLKKSNEIEKVRKRFGFDNTFVLDIPSTKIDQIPMGELVNKVATVFKKICPNILFIPFKNDVHSDHKLVSEVSISCTKWFRYPYIEQVLYYETISETDYNIDSSTKKFNPNVYINIDKYLDEKVEIMKIFSTEISEFPFPRSEKAIRSLAYLRGSQCGADSAEAFELLRANII